MVIKFKSALTQALTAWMNQSPSQKDRQSLDDYLPKADAAEVRTEAEAKLL